MISSNQTTTDVWFYLTQNERGVSAEKGRRGQKVVVSLELFLLWMKNSPSETALRRRLFTEGRIEPLTQSDVDAINLQRHDKAPYAIVTHGAK